MIGAEGSICPAACLDLTKGEERLWEVGRVVANVEVIDARQEGQEASMGGFSGAADTSEGVAIDGFHLFQQGRVIGDVVRARVVPIHFGFRRL